MRRPAGTKPELLAPAGSPDALLAAVNCGCDAVYLGLSKFSARAASVNFSKEELPGAVRFCHERGVAVHLALNTVLLSKAELLEAAEVLTFAAECGVDAVIIQDLGVAALARSIAPELSLHASTQCAVLTPDGMQVLHNLGFSRMVLPRELAAAEIGAFAAAPLETEVFIHGALCMCVSGQCYYSAALGGRSANRGMCAQPCRLPYEGGHPLSLKDLSLLDHVKTLSDLGVTSFKIEGRLKSPTYVAAAVTAARCAIDGRPYDEKLLRGAFSRGGFTDGYFTARRGPGMFGVRDETEKARTRAASEELCALLHTARPPVPVAGEVVLCAGSPVTATVADTDGNTATAVGPAPEMALHRGTGKEDVEKAFYKTGGTPYAYASLAVTAEEGLFVPMGALNALRRDVLSALSDRRCEGYVKKTNAAPVLPDKKNSERKGPAERLILINDLRMLTDRLRNDDCLIGLPLKFLKEALRLVPASRLCAVTPRAPFGGVEPFEEMLTGAVKAGINTVFIHTLDFLPAARTAGAERLIGDFTFNCTNAYAASELKTLGFTDLVLSCEQHPDRVARTDTGLSYGYYVYGRLPLMVTRNCPVKNLPGYKGCKPPCSLHDRKGEAVPVRCDGTASELLNPRPLWLLDKKEVLRYPGLFVLSFTTETPDEADAVLNAYESGSPSPGPFTRGGVGTPAG